MGKAFMHKAVLGALAMALRLGNDLPVRDLLLDRNRRTYRFIHHRSQKKLRILARREATR